MLTVLQENYNNLQQYKKVSKYTFHFFTDTNYVQILPAPSTRGDQCGLCGNFNRNQFDEYMGKDGVTMAPSSGDQVAQWKWKC